MRTKTALTTTLLAALVATTLVGGLSGCEKKGPVEQAAEEIDEGLDTLKNGKESTATKVDDALDEARAGAQDAVDLLKK